MRKIKVYTRYNENKNQFTYRTFMVYQHNLTVGDMFENEEVKQIEEVKPDIRSSDLTNDYRLVYIRTTFNGEYDPANEVYIEYFLAIEK